MGRVNRPQLIIFQVCKDKELSPRERLGVLSFLMQFDIHIANYWQPNVDSGIIEVNKKCTPRPHARFIFVVKGPSRATAHAYT